MGSTTFEAAPFNHSGTSPCLWSAQATLAPCSGKLASRVTPRATGILPVDISVGANPPLADYALVGRVPLCGVVSTLRSRHSISPPAERRQHETLLFAQSDRIVVILTEGKNLYAARCRLSVVDTTSCHLRRGGSTASSCRKLSPPCTKNVSICRFPPELFSP